MKRMLLVVIAFIALLFSACGGSSAPEGTSQKKWDKCVSTYGDKTCRAFFELGEGLGDAADEMNKDIEKFNQEH